MTGAHHQVPALQEGTAGVEPSPSADRRPAYSENV